jgi:hypothetical protein
MKYILKIYLSIIFCLFIYQSNLIAANLTDTSFIIKLATVTGKFDESQLDQYNILKKYGEIKYLKYPNGVTKIFMRSLTGKNFKSRNEANNILKAVKKYSKFKKSYLEISEDNEIFNSPKMEIKEKELVISFKINDKGNSIETKPNINEDKIYYRIQLGCLSKDNDLDNIRDRFKIKKDEIVRRDEDNHCVKFLLGKYDSYKDALERLQKMRDYNFDEPFIVEELWDKKENKVKLTRVNK